MTVGPINEPCSICGDREDRCCLCQGEIETAHEQALEQEGTGMALAFAELGFAPGFVCEPWRTLPLGWRVSDFELVA